MQTLDQLTQSHLSVLVLDKDSHNPIVRMPIYAEVSIVEETPSYKISGDDLGVIAENSDFFGSETVGAALRLSLAQYIEENTFRGLDEERKQAFLKRVVNILEHEEGLFSKSESEIKDIVDRAILKAMEEFEIPQSQTSSRKSVYSYPLGYLATDHVGYASFDLTRISDLTRSRNNSFAAFDRNRTQTSYAFFVYPMGKEGTRFDALEQGRFTSEAVFAKLSIEQPTLTRDLKILNLPSMQKPGLIDWYFSPGSFAAHPEFLVGDDGCERLFPAQIALQEFNLRQVVRIAGSLPQGVQIPEGYKFAWVDDYKVTWQSLGHSLGEILYSLPLAPGESVKLAVIDWSWESTTQRTEQTVLSEEVLHQTHRDRTISETIKAGLRELQKGSSFIGGIAGSAGATGSIGVASGAVGIAGSLGGSTATSEGSRDLIAENVQRLNDSFSQASSAQRELNSTVVIQARQEERESIQTRTFTNYNHSHTLTILYYEVLRHFKVVVEWVRRRPAILVKLLNVDLSKNDQCIKYRFLLESNLIDEKVKPGFDALEKLMTIQESYTLNGIAINNDIDFPKPFSEGDIEFTLFEMGIKTGGDQTDDKVIAYIRTHTGEFIKLVIVDDNDYLNIGDRFWEDKKSWFFVQPKRKVKWREIAGFEFTLPAQDLAVGDKFNSWSLDEITINAFFVDGVKKLAENDPVNLHFRGVDWATNSFTRILLPGTDAQLIPSIKKPEKLLSQEEYYSIKKLKDHLINFSDYYNRVICLSKDQNTIAIEFESVDWDGTSKLIDHVEPYPLETFGSYIAYPFIDTNNQLPNVNLEGLKKYAEKLITLPTRGVFAEGKLGHCNISEEIDNTRFWKWEEHPIPFEAPGINPVTPVTPQPQQTNVTPTAFPTSLVNIVNPSAAPDPTGLAAALTVLGTPNIFRDMSGQQEVADLLKKLSDNTISIAEASNKAREIQSKYGGSGVGTGGGASVAGRQGSSGGSVQSPAPSEQHDQLQVLRNAANNGDITTEKKNQLAQDYLQNSTQPKLMLASAISEDAGTGSGSNEFHEFYTKYLDQQYPNKYPLEDSLYTRNRDFYTQRAYQKAFGQKDGSWNPELGFKLNERIIRRLYDYYQVTYKAKSDKFLWAGLGRMAGGAVLGGLLTTGLPDPSFLSDTMVLIGKAIFLDLAWQHELFLDDPQKAIDMAREHDTRFPAKAKYEMAWNKIASNTTTEVAEGNRMLLENEQFTIIQPLYDRIKQASEWFTPLLFAKTSAFTLNVHPYHLPFAESFPTTRSADVTVANDRWEWITKQDGMWDKWIRIPADERSRLVDLSMDDLLTRRWGSVKPEFLPPGGRL
ncbi:hypothetical protein [aff. Roholtiella sp. LEGE 12411]|uniref:hypothetical protein n=1 Tax=aff. Roholtiella sp. LEGE 12411 TaxID=1828822 RepID=UPI001882A86C|nr:hypothetical protein [aff. Roholtiella sp. LEGE 12411]MBE9036439.1 hypothetical protein [aff. Roholtiella sp. LEGE 12411]